MRDEEHAMAPGSCLDMNMVSSRFRFARYSGRVGRITRDQHLEECLLFKAADHPDMRSHH